jgi:hypothetical protein
LKAFHVVLADLQGHHEWKALAILKMAGSRSSSALTASARYLWRSLKTSNEQTAIDNLLEVFDGNRVVICRLAIQPTISGLRD